MLGNFVSVICLYCLHIFVRYNSNRWKNEKVYLLGAGAALDWAKAPSTVKITNDVISNGFKNKDGEDVTKVIYYWLSRSETKKGHKLWDNN